MKAPHLRQGERAEQLARKHLEKKGLKHLHSNYRCKPGEIDLIMQHGNSLVFVEVRFRKNTRFGLAAETVNPAKQRKIIRAAQHYLCSRRGPIPPCRFDIISISGYPGQENLDWIPNAFQADA